MYIAFQIVLIRNMFDHTKIPKPYFKILVEYLREGKGKVLNEIKKQATQILEEKKKKEEEKKGLEKKTETQTKEELNPEEEEKQKEVEVFEKKKYKRAKVILQLVDQQYFRIKI